MMESVDASLDGKGMIARKEAAKEIARGMESVRMVFASAICFGAGSCAIRGPV